MYSVLTIADAILKTQKRLGKALTPLQLVKLTYIANGWSLALREAPLFRERIEAWRYGPVIPELYRAVKRFGRDPIPFDALDDRDPPVDVDTLAFIEDVVAKYGDLSGIALSHLTHQSGTPWSQVYDPERPNAEITRESIAHHYTAALNEHRRSIAAE